MRLSDIKGERTIEVIAEIIEPIANIAETEAAAELFRLEKLPEGMTAKAFLLKRVKKHLPHLLKTHKGDIIAILAAVEGTSPQAYTGALNLIKLIKDATELLSDEAFTELFISAQSEKPSGSALENTEGQEAQEPLSGTQLPG